MRDQDDGSGVLYQLFSMIVNILGSPPLPIPFPFPTAATLASSSSAPSPQVSPIGFAGLFIGISFAMMLFGTAIFVIGFMLMPLIIALVMLFYLARIVSNLSHLASIVIVPSSKIVTAKIRSSLNGAKAVK
ncbi:hypothetical protein L1987_36484 [Smallanthus sonchifolius]|uniref:Uncharacterized protein n=1 Tax=Smallanthus sonchifolius TaxID=185202 RepID=A0ACB9HEX2_9ASTR|nr:hypothetical protein L1987_36484 [Smallanthus sonchifolius]